MTNADAARTARQIARLTKRIAAGAQAMADRTGLRLADCQRMIREDEAKLAALQGGTFDALLDEQDRAEQARMGRLLRARRG
jgi:hypothetical protein